MGWRGPNVGPQRNPERMATLFIIVITGIVTLIAFQKPIWSERLLFRPRDILVRKEYHRVLTSALIHADWMHVIFNLMALHSFGKALEVHHGPWVLVFIYLVSILGGSLLSLWLHRNEDYAALGASGGVCGVMFATIFLVEGTDVMLFLIPIPVPGGVFALLYLVGTFIALKQGGGRIGHDAHFGGAAVGLLLALLIDSKACLRSPWLFLGALVFSVTCLLVLGRDLLHWRGAVARFRKPPPAPPAGRFGHLDENRARREEREEIDRILEKIARRGISSLTAEERRKLQDSSRGKG